MRVSQNLGLQYERDFWALGYVDDFELQCLYHMAKALVMPTIYQAGSFPIIEAAIASCPVICSNIPVHVEQAELLGNNIWLFDPQDANNLADIIEQMLINIEVTSKRAKLAAEMVGQVYSWQMAAEGYLSVFREALKGSITNTAGISPPHCQDNDNNLA